ncbi:MAG: YtpI family protein [Paenibacillaceae bacterium]
MLVTLQYILYVSFIIAIGFSIYYSVKFRRERRLDHRGLLQAKQNISMGIMLILLALYPLLIISGSSIGIVIGAMFLLMGLFNLFAGIRNHTTYRARLSKIDQ